MQQRPKVAVIDPNTLSVLGLKQILQNVIPIMTVDTFGAMSEFLANHPEEYFHYFVSMNIVLENRAYFTEHRRQTIVLTLSLEGGSQLSEFHTICINVPEQELVRSLLTLQQHAHPQGKNLPPLPQILQQKILSDREIEVMSLIVQGYINKEIADKLCLSVNTVTTHRRNIARKLQIHSPAGITIYAIVNKLVTIDEVNGQAFDPAALYAVITSNANLNGMDSSYMFKAAAEENEKSTVTTAVVRDVIWMYISGELDNVIDLSYAEAQGRITVR